MQTSVPRGSKAPRGLFVLLPAGRIFTAISISPSPSSRQSRSGFAFRAGRNLPDKEFRYLRTVHNCYFLPISGILTIYQNKKIYGGMVFLPYSPCLHRDRTISYLKWSKAHFRSRRIVSEDSKTSAIVYFLFLPLPWLSFSLNFKSCRKPSGSRCFFSAISLAIRLKREKFFFLV